MALNKFGYSDLSKTICQLLRIPNRPKLVFKKYGFIAANLISMKWQIVDSQDSDISRYYIAVIFKKCLYGIVIQHQHVETCKFPIEINTNISCGHKITCMKKRDILNVEVYIPWNKNNFSTRWFIITVDERIHEYNITYRETIDSDTATCFADCTTDYLYLGIRSSDIHDNDCRNTLNKSKMRCIIKDKFPVCNATCDDPLCNGDVKCDVPQCDEAVKSGKCVEMISTTTAKESLIGMWKHEGVWNGYIVLLFDLYRGCEQAIKYGPQRILDHSRIKNFYKPCELYDSSGISSKMEFEFKNLNKTNNFKVFIIPILKNGTTGFMRAIFHSEGEKEWQRTILMISNILILLVTCVVVICCIKMCKTSSQAQNIYNPSMFSNKKDEFVDYVSLNSKKHYKYFKDQFRNLNQTTSQMITATGLTTTTGNLKSNAKLNIAKYIPPYDQTRIKLEKRTSSTDYINASGIRFGDDTNDIRYIACQGPKKETMSDFVQMIWDNRINCIIMLNQKREKDNPKFQLYFPEKSKVAIVFENSFKMDLKSQNKKNGYVERKLILTNEEKHEKRTIVHLQILSWNENSVPDIGSFSELLLRIQNPVVKNIKTPYLIHCSDGAGRTGTFIALDRITQQITKGINEINVFSTILELRKCRPMMVRSVNHYVFIHQFLVNFLNEK